jgi:hypothetical protein
VHFVRLTELLCKYALVCCCHTDGVKVCAFGGSGGHHRAPVAFLHLMRILVVGCETDRRCLRCLALAIAPSISRTRSCLVSMVSAAITCRLKGEGDLPPPL